MSTSTVGYAIGESRWHNEVKPAIEAGRISRDERENRASERLRALVGTRLDEAPSGWEDQLRELVHDCTEGSRQRRDAIADRQRAVAVRLRRSQNPSDPFVTL